MQIFVEGPADRGFVPLEGEELQRALESLWETSPTDFADAYIDYDFCERVELVGFARRLSGLIWLHRTVAKGVDAITKKHSHLERTGEHRVPGWAGESDMLLEEEIYLRQDVLNISAGSIIVACAAALESLVTDLLDRDQDKSLHKKGLQQKINALIERRPDLPEPDQIREDVKWIADRRNAFAHSLLDEVELSAHPQKSLAFDNDAVEEAFERAGAIATNLAIAQNSDFRPADEGNDAASVP